MYDQIFGYPINGLFPLVSYTWLSRWIPKLGVPCSKALGGSKVDSAFHPSEVDQVSTTNFWELSGKE